MTPKKYEGLSKEDAWAMFAAGMETACTMFGQNPPSVEEAFKAGFDAGRCQLYKSKKPKKTMRKVYWWVVLNGSDDVRWVYQTRRGARERLRVCRKHVYFLDWRILKLVEAKS